MRALDRFFLALWLLGWLSAGGFAQPGTITTVAGNGSGGFSGDGGPANAAQLHTPRGVAVDAAGIIYIADQENNRIRKVTTDSVIDTVAGNGAPGFGGDLGPAKLAQLWLPAGVSVDAAGNLYIVDQGNSRIRKVTTTGLIGTVAGNGTPGFGGDGGSAASAQLNRPSGLAVASNGNIYIADHDNHRVRKLTPGGVITTAAGNGTAGFNADGIAATLAKLDSPSGVAVDASGNLYIADSGNDRIRKVTAAGVISTVVGTGEPGFGGDGGQAASAQLNTPTGVAVDTGGNLYIVDSGNNRIRKVTVAGVISTIAGSGSSGTCGTGGPATQAQLSPYGVAVDPAGNVFIADPGNNRISMVTPGNSFDLFFPQVAAGEGYSTLFTITNAEAAPASGNLILTDQQGNPLSVSATLTDAAGVTQPATTGSAFSLTIPSGGTIQLSAVGPTSTSPLKVGWGRFEAVSGSTSGVATYENAVDGSVRTIVGVLHSQPLIYATIPVDNNGAQGKQTAYAIANPGGQEISVKLALVSQNGSVVDDTLVVKLGPGDQVARYLWQDLPYPDFKGSLVLRGQAHASYVAVALVEKQGILTAIPLIPGKAPGVPD